MPIRSPPWVLTGVILLTAAPAWTADRASPEDDPVPPRCEEARKRPLPAADLPTDKDKVALKGCSSTKLYYGIDGPRDDVAARKCAYLELNGPLDSWTAGGRGVLAMIYANGRGVSRDLDLAEKMVCDDNDASKAELEGRLEHLEAIRATPAGQRLKQCEEEKGFAEDYCRGVFDLCDDATSRVMFTVCATIHTHLEDQEVSAKLTQVSKRWSAADRHAFQALSTAAMSYFKSHAGEEIDQSGTLGAQLSQGTQAEELDNFITHLRAFEKGELPTFTHAEFVQADAQLNATYKKRMGENFAETSTLTAAGVQATERLWLKYRDAWFQFAALHYPRTSKDALGTWLTRERTERLEHLGVVDWMEGKDEGEK